MVVLDQPCRDPLGDDDRGQVGAGRWDGRHDRGVRDQSWSTPCTEPRASTTAGHRGPVPSRTSRRGGGRGHPSADRARQPGVVTTASPGAISGPGTSSSSGVVRPIRRASRGGLDHPCHVVGMVQVGRVDQGRFGRFRRAQPQRSPHDLGDSNPVTIPATAGHRGVVERPGHKHVQVWGIGCGVSGERMVSSTEKRVRGAPAWRAGRRRPADGRRGWHPHPHGRRRSVGRAHEGAAGPIPLRSRIAGLAYAPAARTTPSASTTSPPASRILAPGRAPA